MSRLAERLRERAAEHERARSAHPNHPAWEHHEEECTFFTEAADRIEELRGELEEATTYAGQQIAKRQRLEYRIEELEGALHGAVVEIESVRDGLAYCYSQARPEDAAGRLINLCRDFDNGLGRAAEEIRTTLNQHHRDSGGETNG